MTFARFLIELRRRAAALPAGPGRPAAIERVCREILAEATEGEQDEPARGILAAFLGLGEGDKFDAELLEQMTPELVLRLDMLAAELLERGRTAETVRALRAALLRRVH